MTNPDPDPKALPLGLDVLELDLDLDLGVELAFDREAAVEEDKVGVGELKKEVT